jgi:NAD(P)-dependent dehydrogenase (short-subunit alcohol dehydrogenase family)/acyl dehydratase
VGRREDYCHAPAAVIPQSESSVTDTATVTFSKDDLTLFSKASGDRNPLHLSEEYARGTPYGEPVVFGCLGALACLGHVLLPAGELATLHGEFLRPMFPGVHYRVESTKKEGNWVARLLDGSLPVVSLTITPGSQTEGDAEAGLAPTGCFDRREPAVRTREEIVPGLEISGHYACDAAAVAALAERWRVDPFLAMTLAWSSYLVGMQLPGESALFSKIVLNFHRTVPASARMCYRASVVSVDSRFDQIRMDVSLCAGASTVVSGQCWSFIRPSTPQDEEIDLTAVNPDSLAGRATVLIGASRGLGAAIKRALELRGAAVYSLSRSATGAQTSRTEVGDAADAAALQRLRERVWREQTRLDFLICNAFPSILPLRLEENGAERIAAYINRAMLITLTPLCAFLELLNESNGCLVMISSTVVEQPVREWPHYNAAKQAVEMLARVASLQYPNIPTLIVRPHKLLTAMTNTPLGRRGAGSPGMLADQIAARLEDTWESGKVEILTWTGDSYKASRDPSVNFVR